MISSRIAYVEIKIVVEIITQHAPAIKNALIDEIPQKLSTMASPTSRRESRNPVTLRSNLSSFCLFIFMIL